MESCIRQCILFGPGDRIIKVQVLLHIYTVKNVCLDLQTVSKFVCECVEHGGVNVNEQEGKT